MLSSPTMGGSQGWANATPSEARFTFSRSGRLMSSLDSSPSMSYAFIDNSPTISVSSSVATSPLDRTTSGSEMAF